MPIPRPSQEEIIRRTYNAIRNETPITANLDSSVIGVIIKIFAAEMNVVWDYIDQLAQQSNLTTAVGGALDNFGLLFGVTRKSALSGSTIGSSRAVRFTNTGNTIVVVPTGTRVYKASDPQVAYFTTEGATISAGATAEVHVTAANTGEIYNVGIGELTKHALPNVSLAVTNILPIQNGSSRESDGSYRERLLQDIRRRRVVNASTVSAMLRSVPGVRDVWILDLKRGAGTFDAVIIPYNQGLVSEVISECQRLLDEAVPAGISALAKAPQYRQLDVKVNLRFTANVGNRRESIREIVRSLIISQVDNLPIEDGSGSGTFNTAQIRAFSISSDAAILDAMVILGLDGVPISTDGEIRLGIGERLVLRGLSVE